MKLLRVVRMEFKEEFISDFEKIYQESSPLIKRFPGCSHVEMCKDPHNHNVRFTFSHWESEVALNFYRESKLFIGTWARTKVLFADKPRVYSLISTED